MWLINTSTLELESFQSQPPPYGILSHRWGSDKDEVSFKEWNADHADISNKPGYIKILKASEVAQSHGLGYLWVDTNCIDKSSSAELSEAINSMYRYYSAAAWCYVYLDDVSGNADLWAQDSEFRVSQWFTRGWTLQELLAPEPARLIFFSREWRTLGTKQRLCDLVYEITSIEQKYLRDLSNVRNTSVSCRMSWVSNRITTRLEDIAYCMLGIFDINLVPIYGEGSRAFHRLQEEILRNNYDHTIFAWDWLPQEDPVTGNYKGPRRRQEYLWNISKAWSGYNPQGHGSSMLAPDPIYFSDCGDCFHGAHLPDASMLEDWSHPRDLSTLTQLGISIALPVAPRSGHDDEGLAVINVRPGLRKHYSYQTGHMNGLALILQPANYSNLVDRRRGCYRRSSSYPASQLFTVSLTGPLLEAMFNRRSLLVSRNPRYNDFSTPGAMVVPEFPMRLGVWYLSGELTGVEPLQFTSLGPVGQGHSFGPINFPHNLFGIPEQPRPNEAYGGIFKVYDKSRTKCTYVLVRSIFIGSKTRFVNGAERRFIWNLSEISLPQESEISTLDKNTLWNLSGKQGTLDSFLGAVIDEPAFSTNPLPLRRRWHDPPDSPGSWNVEIRLEGEVRPFRDESLEISGMFLFVHTVPGI
jgi:hypothetical protein